MLDTKSPIEVLGLILALLGVFATAHTVLERIFKYSLFTTLLAITPLFLRSWFPHEPSILWFENRSTNRNIYESWDVAFIYLFLLPIILFLNAGFFTFVILRLVDVYHITIPLLIAWFLLILVSNFMAACNQAALKFKDINPTLNDINQILAHMQRHPYLTLRFITGYFFLNWIKTPITTLVLLCLFILLVLLYWPAWLIRALQRTNKLPLTRESDRTNYLIVYSVIFICAGLLLNFIFS
jgi:hypothetical protein